MQRCFEHPGTAWPLNCHDNCVDVSNSLRCSAPRNEYDDACVIGGDRGCNDFTVRCGCSGDPTNSNRTNVDGPVIPEASISCPSLIDSERDCDCDSACCSDFDSSDGCEFLVDVNSLFGLKDKAPADGDAIIHAAEGPHATSCEASFLQRLILVVVVVVG